MDANFWHKRWHEGQTGWHQDEVDRMLQRYWPDLAPAPGSLVLVPLCGASLDMAWLAARGHRVLGIELSALACERFFAQLHITPKRHRQGEFERFDGGGVSLLCGDVFKLDEAQLAAVDAVYDRAALVALPPAMRIRYARSLYGRLRVGCSGLLQCFEYAQDRRDGPPFSVEEQEVRRLLEPDWSLRVLDRRDIIESEPRFAEQGLDALHLVTLALRRVA